MRPAQRQLEIAERRRRVADLYPRGCTQWEIARSFGVDQGQVSRDLAHVRSEWLAVAVQDFNEHKSRELARIDAVERTAWEAFERSCKQASKRTAKKVSGGKAREEATLHEQGRDGDPRFLQVVLDCVRRRCLILGLEAPKKIAPTTPDGSEPYAVPLEAVVAARARAEEYRRDRAQPSRN